MRDETKPRMLGLLVVGNGGRPPRSFVPVPVSVGRATVAAWAADAPDRETADRLVRSLGVYRRLDTLTHVGCVALVDERLTARAVALLESDVSGRIVLHDVATRTETIDATPGTTMVRTFARVRPDSMSMGQDLDDRWRLEYALHSKTSGD